MCPPAPLATSIRTLSLPPSIAWLLRALLVTFALLLAFSEFQLGVADDQALRATALHPQVAAARRVAG